MTNIEFLVNELRKANETIENLRKDNKELKEHLSHIEDYVRALEVRHETVKSIFSLCKP